MSRAAAAETGTPSEGVPRDTTDRVHGQVATAVPPAWALEVEAVVVAAVVEAAAGAADKRRRFEEGNQGRQCDEINVYESNS
jgi:hypothetical protein